MIAPQHLRIGNLVQDKEFPRLVSKIEMIGSNGIIMGSYDEGSNIENFNPIPLDEEWLERLDFDKQGSRDMWINGKVCVIKVDNKYYIGFKDDSNILYHTQFEAPYVHSLQNAFALTGKELTLKEK